MRLPAAVARRWIAEWDLQQERYIPDREARFEAMFDVLAAHLPERFRVLDLACGPGSLSSRLLARFPRALATAVDFDPVLLALGRSANARSTTHRAWVEADLRSSGWTRALPGPAFDAVLTTTALHWFDAPTLARLYNDLAGILRPEGLFLNGDEIRREADPPEVRALFDEARARARAAREARTRGMEWDEWWRRVVAEPSLADAVAERTRRFPKDHRDEVPIALETHERALRAAGFRAVGVVRQRFDDRVLVAIR